MCSSRSASQSRAGEKGKGEGNGGLKRSAPNSLAPADQFDSRGRLEGDQRETSLTGRLWGDGDLGRHRGGEEQVDVGRIATRPSLSRSVLPLFSSPTYGREAQRDSQP
jgi:hypothetical protein